MTYAYTKLNSLLVLAEWKYGIRW